MNYYRITIKISNYTNEKKFSISQVEKHKKITSISLEIINNNKESG